MISIHELSLMMGHHPTEAEEGLAEVAEAASVPMQLREIAARLGDPRQPDGHERYSLTISGLPFWEVV